MKLTPILITCSLCTAASAQVLMMNFGSTAVPGGQATDSPYHTEMPSFVGGDWNEAGNGDLASLTFADGTSATGISMEIGSSSNGPVVDFSVNPASSNTLAGGSLNQWYYDTTTMSSTTWNGGDAFNNLYVGIRIDGLAAGEYEVFLWGNNGNLGADNPMAAYVGSAPSAGTFNFSSISPEQIANTATADSWTDTVTYSSQTVVLGAGDSLYVAMDGVNPTQNRGFLSGVQVATIPEPSAYAAMLGLVGLLFCLRRRR